MGRLGKVLDYLFGRKYYKVTAVADGFRVISATVSVSRLETIYLNGVEEDLKEDKDLDNVITVNCTRVNKADHLGSGSDE